MSIFKVKQEKVELIPEAYKLCPGLSLLKEDTLKYIIYVYDNSKKNPLSRKPEHERKIQAKRWLWNNDTKNPESSSRVREAINEYKSLIYDEREEIINACKSKLAILNKEIAKPDVIDSKQLSDLDKSISLLQKRVEQLEKEIDLEEEMVELKGNKELSWLERMKRSRELFQIKERVESKVNNG